MNPIFKEYISFLKDKKINLDLKEGYYWLDKQIIKCFDINGKEIKIARLYIDDDLDVEIKTIYKNKPFQIESWQDTVTRNIDNLSKIEEESLQLIKESIEKYNGFSETVLSSGGKDSEVVTYLVKQIKNDVNIIFNNTTLDCADTYLHIKNKENLTIITPDEGFYQWRKRLNFIPTRFSRACCSIFKEGAMVDKLDKTQSRLFFMGMRNQESSTRSGYGDYWKNDKWSNMDWEAVLPIRKWSELDVWLYILWKNININPKYKKGYSRCGCHIACPYYSKSTWILDKYWYPKQFNRWQEILKEDFINNNKALIMNCTLEEYMINWNGGTVRDIPTQEVMREFADHNNLDIKTAMRYFGKKCCICGKIIKDKETLAMNMKYHKNEIEKYCCKKHFLSLYNLDKDDWKEEVLRFKDDGCVLF